jgi:hypothetical protein
MEQDEPFRVYVTDDGKERDGALAREAAVYAAVVLGIFIALIFVLT